MPDRAVKVHGVIIGGEVKVIGFRSVLGWATNVRVREEMEPRASILFQGVEATVDGVLGGFGGVDNVETRFVEISISGSE
ncbi:hypothetical protein RND71_019269 [Anisodus tanguticus]|uniref:Uncharacterized protein n=1 Tax=Anisodus tanguticus TaxID=243964 RepID=A0AAE1S071_9SOLA|nr:hypothetical protein RND71_019269 [Anisodus tanguticus]